MPAYSIGQGSATQGVGNLSLDLLTAIRSTYIDTQYSEMRAFDCIAQESVDTTPPLGSQTAMQRIRDMSGVASFIDSEGSNINTVGVGVDALTVPLRIAAVSGTVTIEDVRAFNFGQNINLVTATSESIKLAEDRHIEHVFFFGYPDFGMDGFLNSPSIPIKTATSNAAGGGTDFASATADECVQKLQTAMLEVYAQTKGIFVPNFIALPPSAFAALNSKRMDGTGISALNYFLDNNLCLTKTGQQPKIVDLTYLTEAAADGTSDRMVVKVMDRETDWFPFPEQPNLLPPQIVGLGTKFFGIHTIGPYSCMIPKKALYVDGV